jgi:hypothetical protein
MLQLKDGAPVLLFIEGRRYTICATRTHYADGTPTNPHGPGAYCGALIDVTEQRQIRVTDDCGTPANHIAVEDVTPTPW